jgi:hypothetical protein
MDRGWSDRQCDWQTMQVQTLSAARKEDLGQYLGEFYSMLIE